MEEVREAVRKLKEAPEEMSEDLEGLHLEIFNLVKKGER